MNPMTLLSVTGTCNNSSLSKKPNPNPNSNSNYLCLRSS